MDETTLESLAAAVQGIAAGKGTPCTLAQAFELVKPAAEALGQLISNTEWGKADAAGKAEAAKVTSEDAAELEQRKPVLKGLALAALFAGLLGAPSEAYAQSTAPDVIGPVVLVDGGTAVGLGFADDYPRAAEEQGVSLKLHVGDPVPFEARCLSLPENERRGQEHAYLRGKLEAAEASWLMPKALFVGLVVGAIALGAAGGALLALKPWEKKPPG